MRIGSLFAGIGGLDLGLERAGVGHTIWQVERDEYARLVLAKHWPDAVRYDDVRDIGTTVDVEPVDVLCGGFPCQDISTAGKGGGLDGERSGLWFEFLRIIRLLRPRFVVLENVAAILVRGADRVLGGLAESGYDAWWDCIPAAAVGAPHRRDRWFCVAWLADAAGDRCLEAANERTRARRADRFAFRPDVAAALRHVRARHQWAPEPGVGRAADGVPSGLDRPAVTWPTPKAVDANGHGWHGGPGGRVEPTLSGAAGAAGGPRGRPFPTRPTSAWERDVPRTVVSTEAPSVRNARLRALGNAVCPQVAEVVGRVLLDIESQLVRRL